MPNTGDLEKITNVSNVNIYYNTTHNVDYLSQIKDISVVNIQLLQDQEYNINYNVPINAYLSSTLLYETDNKLYTRGIDHLDKILNNKCNKHIDSLIWTYTLTSLDKKIYTDYIYNFYLPSTCILPSACIIADYMFNYNLPISSEFSAEHTLKIPSSVISMRKFVCSIKDYWW